MTDKLELRRLAEAECISSELGSFDNPKLCAAILELIAENDHLNEEVSESAELCDRLAALLRSSAIEVRGPEAPLKRHGFHDLPSRVKVVVSERDQLNSDNKALRKAVEFAAKAFGEITSADGSGHADISLAVLRIAGRAMEVKNG